MDSIEKKMLLGMVAIIALAIGSCAILVNSLEAEFTGCKGLEGAVNHVWTGEPCEGSASE